MLFRKRPSVVSFRIALIVGAGAVAVLAIGTPEARAFPTYSGWWLGECRTCHGDFLAANYQPPSRDQEWTPPRDSLHTVHAFVMLGGDCLACHMSFSEGADVSLSESGSADFPMSCIGCHGRAEDDAGGLVTGAGLRRHHWNGGVPCTPCHADSEPAFGFTPVGEYVLPPNYDVGLLVDLTDPCNPGGSGEDIAGSTLGLDNDGDGFYDEDDLDCDAPQPPTRCGLGSELAVLLPALAWLRRYRRRGMNSGALDPGSRVTVTL